MHVGAGSVGLVPESYALSVTRFESGSATFLSPAQIIIQGSLFSFDTSPFSSLSKNGHQDTCSRCHLTRLYPVESFFPSVFSIKYLVGMEGVLTDDGSQRSTCHHLLENPTSSP